MGNNKLPRIKRVHPIDPKESKAFLRLLPLRVRTLTELYLFAGQIFAEIGLLYYWKEMLQLPANSINEGKSGIILINFYRNSPYANNDYDWITHFLPVRLGRKLLMQSKLSKSGLLFELENGKTFNHKHLSRAFCNTSKKALDVGVIKQAITPSSMRITVPKDEVMSPINGLAKIIEVKIQEIEYLTKSFCSNKGAPRKSDLQEILRVLLFQERSGYSRRELIKKFPLARAAESQKRRWVEKGIWSQIRSILLS